MATIPIKGKPIQTKIFGLNIFYLNYQNTYIFTDKGKQTCKFGFEQKPSAY